MWRIKVFIQFLLSYLPFGERINFQLQVLRGSHSPRRMKQRIFELIDVLKRIDERKKIESTVVVEVGTGWYAILPIMLYMFGAKRCYSYDHVAHVRLDLVRRFVDIISDNLEEFHDRSGIELDSLKRRLDLISSYNNFEEFCCDAGIEYRAPGDACETGLKNDSVDLFVSYAVLEHVPKPGVSAISIEAARVVRLSGVVYHLIGLHDHYSCMDPSISKINFLKYSDRIWSFFTGNNISFHNRMREPEFLNVFNRAGLEVVSLESKVDEEDLERVKGMSIDDGFEGFDDRELVVYEMEIFLKPSI